jgi:K+-sensing histidine kinase KdpD
MEHILICMDECRRPWEALSHAILLGKRITGVIYVLRVERRKKKPEKAVERRENWLQERLDREIEAAKAEGVRIEYFEAKGVFEEEVIRFAESHHITLLVVEIGQTENLQKIRHRIACRVELVTPKWNRNSKAARGSIS